MPSYRYARRCAVTFAMLAGLLVWLGLASIATATSITGEYLIITPDEVTDHDTEISIQWDYYYGHQTDVSVFDEHGELVVTLVDNEFYPEGIHTITWDTRVHGQPLKNGTYTIKMTPLDEWEEYSQSAILTILRPPLLEVNIDYPAVKLNSHGWYNPNPLPISISITNRGGDLAPPGSLYLLGSPSGRWLRRTHEDTWVDRWGWEAHVPALDVGQTFEHETYLWLQPGDPRTIFITFQLMSECEGKSLASTTLTSLYQEPAFFPWSFCPGY